MGHAAVESAEPLRFPFLSEQLVLFFGDIGTNPLYTLKTAFAFNGSAMSANTETIFGLISLVFWAVILIVSVKYVVFVMHADNGGEGGVMALVALVRKATQIGRASGREGDK